MCRAIIKHHHQLASKPSRDRVGDAFEKFYEWLRLPANAFNEIKRCTNQMANGQAGKAQGKTARYN